MGSWNITIDPLVKIKHWQYGMNLGHRYDAVPMPTQKIKVRYFSMQN